ncbi:MAG: hypothetical protein ACO395_07395 [Pontimonas sp.]
MPPDNQDGKIPPGVRTNWHFMQQFFERGNSALVVCEGPDGKHYNVICSLSVVKDENGEDTWQYAPFGLMVGNAIRPLLDSLTPPPHLQGRWAWPPRPNKGIFP